jgi:hypothetical protein
MQPLDRSKERFRWADHLGDVEGQPVAGDGQHQQHISASSLRSTARLSRRRLKRQRSDRVTVEPPS